MAVQLADDIGLSVNALGLVFATYFTAAAVFSAPLSRVTQRRGPQLMLRIGMSIYAFALVGIAAVASTPAVLAAFVGLAGFGTALTRTASSVLLAVNVPPERQGLAFGLKTSAIPVATLAAGVAVPAIALTVGWRWAYAIAAVLACAVVPVIPPATRNRDKPASSVTDLPRWHLLTLSLAFALGAAPATALGAYTVSTAVLAGIAEGMAGVLVAAGSVVGLASRLLLGSATDRRGGSQLDLVALLLAAGGVGYLLFALSAPAAVVTAMFVTFATGWSWMGTFTLSIVRLNRVAPSPALGLTQAGTFFGAIFGPGVFGLLAHEESFTLAWSVAGAMSLASSAIVVAFLHFVLREKRPPGPRSSPRSTKPDEEPAHARTTSVVQGQDRSSRRGRRSPS